MGHCWLQRPRCPHAARYAAAAHQLTVPLVAGVFPILLLAASRCKGEYVPGVIFRVLGYPWVAISVYLFFLANLFLHGLVIWDNPVERAAALVVGMLTLGLTLVMVWRGVFTPRLIVELRHDQCRQ